MVIFYADDDADDREIFGLALSEINPNYKVVYAQDGKEAIDKLLKMPSQPAFIFLDINMPVMTGIECLHVLKKTTPLRSTPVIVYTTTSDQQEVKTYLQLGARDVVTKTNSLEKVKESIQKVFEKEYPNIV